MLPTLTYGSQIWAVTKIDEQKLQVTQNSIERSMLGIQLKDKVRRIKGLLKPNLNVVHLVRWNKWNSAVHVARYRDNKQTSKITLQYNPNKRKKGKQRARWSDSITQFLKQSPCHQVVLPLISVVVHPLVAKSAGLCSDGT